MILQIIAYAVGVAAALCVVGLCLERLAALQGLPRRAAWIVALLLSVLLPAAMIQRGEPAGVTLSVPAPTMQPEHSTSSAPLAKSIAENVLGAPPSGIQQAARPHAEWHLPQLSDRELLLAWAIASALSGLYLVGAHLRLHRRIAGWQRTTLLDHPVLVSETMGPALVGVFRPRVVVPRWVLDEPATTQSLILEHERQHITARDPLLIRAGVVLLAVLPWNLPLWWQWRRMRQAIEMDCDARVLRTGAEPQVYGEVLLALTGRATRMPAGVVAMSEPVSALERRIQSLLPDPVRHAALQVSGIVSLLIVGVGVAFAMDAPAIPARAARHAMSAQPAAVAAQPAPSPRVTIEATPAVVQPRAQVLAAAAAAPAAPTTRPADSAPPAPAALSPRDLALRATALRYPELTQFRWDKFRSAPGSFHSISILMRADGTLLRSSIGVRSPEDPATHGSGAMAGVVNLVINNRLNGIRLDEIQPPPQPAFDAVNEGPQTAKIPKGQPLADVGRALENIVVEWFVVSADYDESRDITHVRDAVRARHADLLRPYVVRDEPGRLEVGVNPDVSVLTVFMTESGQIALAVVESMRREVAQSMNPQPLVTTSVAASTLVPPPVAAEAFKVLGLDAEQIGQTGLVWVEAGSTVIDPGPDRGREFIANTVAALDGIPPPAVIVRYAWPRRPGEPVGGRR